MSIEEQAERAGIPVPQVEALQKAGVYVASNGELWAEECSDARSVRIPTGKRIIC